MIPFDKNLVIRPLSAVDAPQLAAVLRRQPAEYLKYFVPFSFRREAIHAILSNAKQDLYMGMFWQDELVGFFMLRGWDEGYPVPAYGVAIDHRLRKFGLGGVSLELSKTLSRLKGATQMMLKVHPENRVAKQMYEKAGFVAAGVDERSGNLIYNCDLRKTGAVPIRPPLKRRT